MGYKGAGKEVIGGNVDRLVAEYIDARATRIEQSTSWAVDKIVQYWLDHGAPPLGKADVAKPLTYEEYCADPDAHPKSKRREARTTAAASVVGNVVKTDKALTTKLKNAVAKSGSANPKK